MVHKFLLGSALISSASAVKWALLTTGSNTYSNYRHQADLCNAYQILVAKGFSKDRIITMAYDDIADNEANPFPGKVFNMPDPTGPGTDVYNGCNIDYKGDDVTAQNFVSLLLGNGTTGGNGRTLDTGPDDELTILYFDHGAPGLIQFPGGDVLHADDLQTTLKTMHDQNRYGRMLLYIEACNSGSMLTDLPADINIYGVTAVGPDYPSLGTYCGYDAVIDSTPIGSCLGDLFSVFWMKFVSEGDGSNTLDTFFENVYDDVASYAALHYGHELNQQYGDISMGKLTVKDFFYGDSETDIKLAAAFSPKFVAPVSVWAAPRLAMDSHQLAYSETSSQPLFHGEERWRLMLQATSNLQNLLIEQKQTQQLYWDLVMLVYPEKEADYDARMKIWTVVLKPLNPECEKRVHNELLHRCSEKGPDVRTSYALQFHQVVVNLCSVDKLGWGANPHIGEGFADLACSGLAREDPPSASLLV